ncbi:prolipoprotein diacylglyceryl transferase [Marinilactibacillus kalidii]|uniref:prolipoprotein diacylglyceryl transferase n=1 Tax=Marinilactibacillus kalidii TaxID=2820274 RepID=UPI001ABDF8FC|nr:prolipoprotein diacylglyceryl transferase [Marinilactibacillus kalidii]
MSNQLGAIDPVAIRLGPLTVAWYGIIIVTGMFLAVWLSIREGEKRGIEEDFIVDLAFRAIPAGLIGARIYYVLFELDVYLQDPIRIFYIWEGGIAIYGGLLAGFATLLWFSKQRNVPVWLLLDVLAPHVMIAQAIGRWGNFVNQEAHGGEVTRSFLERLMLPNFVIEQMNINGVYYHPTFLYESLWNLVGFIVLMIVRSKEGVLRRGEVALGYVAWYSMGRFWIEGMRTDSLYLGPLRVSQVLSVLLFVGAVALILYRRFYQYPTPPYYTEGLLPEKTFAEKKQKAAQKSK